MDILGTVVTCCDLTHKCVQIINEVQAWPEELGRITRRITRLEPLLKGLMSHLQSQSKPGIAGLQWEQKNDLASIIQETKKYCEETHNILGECQSRRIGQTGLEWRESWLGDIFRSIYQKYGAVATDLQTLEENLEKNRRDLDSYMGLLGIRQGQAIHDALHNMASHNAVIFAKIRALELKENERKSLERDNESLKRDNDSLKRDKARLMAQLRNQSVHLAPTTTAPRGGQLNGGSLGTYQSVPATLRQSTPESRPTRTDYKILFIDTYGSRSVLSEFFVKILGAWTQSKGGDWRVETVRSAGFFVRENCDCVSEFEGIGLNQNFLGLSPSGGGWSPTITGRAALYDAVHWHLIPQASKAEIYNQLYNKKNRGLTRDMFRTYDFIIVFSRATHNNLLALRNALVASSGQSILARGKGRIVHLGQFLSSEGDTKDIAEPLRSKEGLSIRENWDQKVLELEFAIKGFLAAELGWKQPEMSD